MAERKCQWCGSEYLPRQENQRFCSSVCSSAWHNEERRRAVEMLRRDRPFTYAEFAQNSASPDQYLEPEQLPAAIWSRDPSGPEPPLGVDIETVPEEARR